MATNNKIWMGVSCSDYSKKQETKWQVLKETVVSLTDEALADVASAKLVEVKNGPSAGEKKVVINLFANPGEDVPCFWFRSDFPLQAIAEDGDKLNLESLRFYFLVAQDEEAEFSMGKQATEFLHANYNQKVVKAVEKIAAKHPTVLVVTGKVATR